jgi:hypothetical protein
MAGHEMVLSESSDVSHVSDYLTQLGDTIAKLQEEAARINKYQALFKVCSQEGVDCARVCENMCLKAVHGIRWVCTHQQVPGTVQGVESRRG